MPPRDLVLVLLVCLTWAGNFLTSALALREIPPVLFTALRFALLAGIEKPADLRHTPFNQSLLV